MKVYSVNILCHEGTFSMSLTTEVDGVPVKYFQSSKQAWFLGNQFVESCPPAGSFEIVPLYMTPRDVCNLLNQ